MNQRPFLSVVIPCYNEEAVFFELVNRLFKVLSEFENSYEIIFINDGSTDSTWNLIQKAFAEFPNIIVGINLSRNFGHQIALSAGLDEARGDFILIMDADLQDPPELLLPMFKLMVSEKADVVYGKRLSRKDESKLRLIVTAIFYRFLAWMSETPIPVDSGDFRLISRRALDLLLKMPERNRFLRGMVSWIGLKQVPFLFERDARFAGKPKYTLTKLFSLAVDAITSFSVKPLRFATYLGTIFAIIGLFGVLYIMVSTLTGNSSAIKGWTSLAIIILTMGGIQIIILGIIGEYIGRIFLETKKRPLYFTSEILRSSEKYSNF